MKHYHLLMIVILIANNTIQTTEPKPSAWSKFKGIFSKKRPADSTPAVQTQPQNVGQGNQPQPTMLGKSKEFAERIIKRRAEILRTAADTYIAIREFRRNSREQLDMIKVKMTTLEAVRAAFKKADAEKKALKDRISAFEKNEAALKKESNKNANVNRILEERLKVEKGVIKKETPRIIETKKRLKEQLGRLRADFFGALIKIPLNAKPVIIYIKLLFNHLELQDGQDAITKLTTLCDELIRRGGDITEQLELKHKAYGTQSVEEPQKQIVVINDYVHSLLQLGQKIQPIVSTIESTMNAINKITGFANKLTLGLIPLLKRVPQFIKDITSVFGHLTELSGEVASVTTNATSMAKVKDEISRAHKLIDEAFPVL